MKRVVANAALLMSCFFLQFRLVDMSRLLIAADLIFQFLKNFLNVENMNLCFIHSVAVLKLAF